MSRPTTPGRGRVPEPPASGRRRRVRPRLDPPTRDTGKLMPSLYKTAEEYVEEDFTLWDAVSTPRHRLTQDDTSLPRHHSGATPHRRPRLGGPKTSGASTRIVYNGRSSRGVIRLVRIVVQDPAVPRPTMPLTWTCAPDAARAVVVALVIADNEVNRQLLEGRGNRPPGMGKTLSARHDNRSSPRRL